MNMPDFDIISLIAGDKKKISYRPAMVKATGSVLATILLSEIVYWYDKMGRVPFHKFTSPVPVRKDENGEEKRHPDYRVGDSWCEALGFSKKEFETARKKIGKKVRKGQPLPPGVLVWYWTDISRRTWYRLNEELFRKCTIGIYVTLQPALMKTPIGGLDKHPTGSSFTTTTTTTDGGDDADASSPQTLAPVINWPDNLVKHKFSLSTIMQKIDPENQQLFLSELSQAIDEKKIRGSVAGYADGMVANDWQPSPQVIEDQRSAQIEKQIEDIRREVAAGASLIVDGKAATEIKGKNVWLEGGACKTLGILIGEGANIETRRAAA